MPRHTRSLAIALALTSFGLVTAQQDSPAFALFRQIVDRLETEYVNPNNLELGSITKRYKAQLEAQCANAGKTCAYTIAEPVIRAMLAEFRDPHLFMTSTLETATAESAVGQLGRDTHRSRYGLRLISMQGNLIVGFMQPETSAAKAGVLVGDRITMIDGSAVRDPIQTMNQLSADEANGKRRTLTLERGQVTKKAEISPSLSAFWKPTLRLLETQTAIITIPSFQGFRPGDGSITTDQVVHDLILEAGKKGIKQLVLDLRFNDGGDMFAAISVAGAFLGKIGKIFENKARDYKFTFTYENGKMDSYKSTDPKYHGESQLERPARWTGPVVILVSSATFSAGEGFAEMLQSARRTKVVGEPTMGAACTSRTPMALMNSASLYFSNLWHLHLDGTGCPSSITPDVTVQPDPKALAEGRDTVLEVGLKTLK
jgi:C-terminal processing protease CtpA/Prc